MVSHQIDVLLPQFKPKVGSLIIHRLWAAGNLQSFMWKVSTSLQHRLRSLIKEIFIVTVSYQCYCRFNCCQSIQRFYVGDSNCCCIRANKLFLSKELWFHLDKYYWVPIEAVSIVHLYLWKYSNCFILNIINNPPFWIYRAFQITEVSLFVTSLLSLLVDTSMSTSLMHLLQ